MFRWLLACALISTSAAVWAEKKDCSDKLVITRFAPSPTGKLHIGGARTALFNYLYAKRTGGKFVLRIEDTDRERSRDEHVDSILTSLKWLGIDWDGEPVIQSERAARHVEVAKEMVERGLAYYCYLSAEELEKMRKSGRKIESPWRDRDPSQAPAGVQPVIRLKAPKEGVTVLKDTVQGTIKFKNKDLDDMILVRSDGTPMYNFAVVVDDHDMGVTHIIRGSDHLTNAARQQLVYEALGWDVPVFAHVPLIHSPEGKKLSKREGALGAPDFKAMGYLPDALRNYLARLGWGHKNDEIFSTEQAAAWFDIKKLGASAARLDMARLRSLNREYIRASSDERLIEALNDILTDEQRAELSANGGYEKLLAVMPELKRRADTLGEMYERARFLWDANVSISEDAAKLVDKKVLADLLPRLEAVQAWDAATVEKEMRAFAAEQGRDPSGVAPSVRLVLTGSERGLPLWDTMTVLGKTEVLSRLRGHL